MKINWLHKIQENLKEQYRLVVLHNETLEEKKSWQFTLYRFFIAIALLIIILISLTIAIISFTPLREYIPGYGNAKQAQQLRILSNKLDSLELIYNQYDYYEKNVRNIFDGNISYQYDTTIIDSIKNIQSAKTSLSLSKTDSILLELDITPPTKISRATTQHNKDNIAQDDKLFFTPIYGIITANTAMQQGIVLDSKTKSSVYAPKSGTIILQEQDMNGNKLIIIQHQSNALSILHLPYCNPLVTTGQFVKEKQVIAILTKDQKVQYELWIDGKEVNPQDYILF